MGVSRSPTDRKTAQIEVRHATRADIDHFYGEPIPWTMRAIAVELDGKLSGLIGVRRDKNWGVYFSDHTEELQPYLKSITMMRVVKQSMHYVREYRGPVFTIATDAEACRLLFRLGFTHLHGEWYGWLS